jgi:tetratricopeptide (TPR) repeat protein
MKQRLHSTMKRAKMSSTRSRFLQRAAIVLLAAVGAALPQVVIAQGGALGGKWLFVPQRSKFSGPAVKEMTVTYSEDGKSKTVEGVDGAGKAVKGTYETVNDNKPHPVTGIGDYDTASWNKLNDFSTVYTYDRRKTTVVVGTRTASKDGKTLTYSERRVDPKGKVLSTSVLFFIKEGVDLASLAPPPGSAPPPPVPVVAPPPPPSSSPDEDAGDAALAAGNDDEAIRLYTAAIDAPMKTPRLYYDYISRGIAYIKKNQTAEAMKDFDEALKLKPEDLEARFRLAGLYVQQKQYEKAIEEYSKYLTFDKEGMDPNRAMALRLRGFSYNTLQQDVKAGADYEAACMINKQLDVCPMEAAPEAAP